MFKAARIRLTFWYLVIIMMVSIIFSMIIYRILGVEVERFARVHIIRTQAQNFTRQFPPEDILPELEQDLIRDAKAHILANLFVVNGIILVFSGALAYFLAGKTLAPIQAMVEEQRRFISDASHELRTPLTALRTSMEVSLRDKKLDIGDARKIISESVEDVNRLQTLSENLLQLTQYQNKNGGMKFERIHLDEAIREAIKKIEPLANKKKISFEVETTPVTAEVNKFSFIDLVMILLDNAVKYSGKNSTINITARKKDKYALLQVEDQGIGILKKDLPYIFDRFYRADSARTKTAGGGYGLGLAIAKRIVEIHKGHIHVESTIGKGTAFIISLPVRHT